ncbi:MAG TPA: multiheme c-type cytochrome [Bryobacteraceae bacterium]|nr:multiheme c-type cytochrome [Bryobacteraceae bacterium]
MKLAGLVFALTSIIGARVIAAENAHFAGAAACVSCHPNQSNHRSSNSMAKALQRAEQASILRENASLTFVEGAYRTTIERDSEGSKLRVTDGRDTVQARILWAFGLGTAGQTYVFGHQGAMYESRVSYYNALKGLGLTMGAQLAKPASLIEAVGRRMDKADVRDCFGCHSTGGVRGNEIAWESMIPGVSCESCHGAAAEHVAARRDGNRTQGSLRKLQTLSAEEMNDLCGTCHRTWGQVIQMNLRGPLNVRFQPYRITNSKCFDAEDRRIACTACHDPHKQVSTSPAAYDSKCLACHSQKGRKTCHTAKANCVTCHMPRVELEGAHFQFADHQIRTVRQGEPYPN